MGENHANQAPGPRPFIIPIFLPHAGCPHRCVFCNQSAITGVNQPPFSPEKLRERINEFLTFKGKERHPVQVAFYGGNFLGQEESYLLSLLKEAATFVTEGTIDSIRISTRPDTISNDRMDILEPYPVSTVELGVQSMDDDVLLLAKRGHTALQTEEAVTLLKKRHFDIGLQMMVGLPGDDETTALNTARRIADLYPDFVRIYPTVVLRDSRLARWYATGKYTPLTLDACVTRVKRLYLLFRERKIPVIRMGLQASEGFENDGSILAGPFHPAFGHLVHSEIFLDTATAALKSEGKTTDSISITVHPHSVSKMRGLENRNIHILKERFSLASIKVHADASIGKEQLSISKNPLTGG